MKKILLSILTIGVVAIAAVYGTQAFFSDTETSTGNILQAGEIDLTVSAKTSSSVPDTSCTFEQTGNGPIFNCTDVKPGDSGESTLHFNLKSNPAWACVYVDNVVDSDNGCNDPELAAESVCQKDGDGELDNALMLTAWIDNDCDNEQNGNEEPLVTNAALSSFGLSNGNYVLPVADTSLQSLLGQRNPLQPSDTDYCIGIKWSVPEETGNEVQTDMVGGDLVFYVEQSRNNENFTCQGHYNTLTDLHTLTLENEVVNETGPWTPITTDTKKATLSWNGDGPTFNYTLSAWDLAPSTSYSLIYYADPWPGNHPGLLIGTHMTDAGGEITGAVGNPDLGMDLPDPSDANYGTGAKIWLIPSAAYNSTTKSVTVWPPVQDTWLFEGNVYIHYNDTDD